MRSQCATDATLSAQPLRTDLRRCRTTHAPSSPKSMLRSLGIFFRPSAPSSNTHSGGLIWSAILTPINFAAHSREAPNSKFVKNDVFCSILTTRKLVFIAVQFAFRSLPRLAWPPSPPNQCWKVGSGPLKHCSTLILGGRGEIHDLQSPGSLSDGVKNIALLQLCSLQGGAP